MNEPGVRPAGGDTHDDQAPQTDYQTEAVKIAGEWNKQFGLWATGAVVLSISFMKDILAGVAVSSGWKYELVASWSFLLLSAVIGVVAYGAPITGAGKPNFRLFVNRQTRWVSLFQAAAFAIGMVLLIVFGAHMLPSRLAAGDPGAPKPNRFLISVSGEVVGTNGTRHTHTFLLDQSTGQVWEMVCSGKSVRFQPVQVDTPPATTISSSHDSGP